MSRKSIEIEIPFQNLKTLREISGYTVAEVAKKLGTTEDKIRSAEEGKSKLTLAQIKKLAEIYKCPLAAFFSDRISPLPPLTDFRINRDRRLTPQVYLAKRRAYYLVSEIERITDKTSIIPQFPDNIKPERLAIEFRKHLGIELIKSKNPKEILRFYKREIEKKMFIPIIERPFKADDVRAFSIFSRVSIIVLNEEDAPQVKLFSLFHEIGHLLRKTSGICSIEIEPEQKEEIESFCNKFAAEFLVPAEDLKFEIERLKLKTCDFSSITKLSEIYGVSKQVIMLRLLWLRYIDRKQYQEFKSGYEEPVKKQFGRRNWDEVFLNRASESIVNEVKQAYKKGIISFADAVGILGIKAKYVEKFLSGAS